MKLILENWHQFVNEAKNKDGKEQGADGKACWDGYKYAGTEDGKDKCVPMEEEQDIDACKRSQVVNNFHIASKYNKDPLIKILIIKSLF